jgi:hypothetical protein
MSNNPKKRRYFLPHDARSKTRVVIPLLLAKEMARLLPKCDGVYRNALTVRINNERKPKDTIAISLGFAEALIETFERYEAQTCECGFDEHITKCPAIRSAYYCSSVKELITERLQRQ